MKKLLIVLMLVLLYSCSNNPGKPRYTYDIQSETVDMSAYEGVLSTKHNFRSIVADEFFNAYDNKSSGIFYLGRSNCNCCQTITKYLSEVASEMGVTVYYMDAYNQKQPITEKETFNKMLEYMNPILNEEDGEKVLLTPHVFTLINGKYVGSQICHDNLDFDNNPTEQQINTLKDIYRAMFEPFVDE